MYNQPPTLPSINTVGNGIEYNSGNGDITRIKQEKEVLHSLPPIRAINDNDNDNNNSNNNSRMSINQLCNDPDEEMKNAAAVLENMKQTALPPIEVSHLSNDSHEESIVSPNPDGLMSRLGEFTLVRKTMTAYEQGKNTLPLIKYTTEMVESSVSRISRISEKIPQLAQLDQYACRGLDKLGEIMDNNSYNYNNNNNSYNNSNDSSSNNNISALHVAMVDEDNSLYEDALVGGDIETRKRKVRGEPMRDSSPSYRSPPSRTHRTSQSNGSQNSPSYAHHNNTTVSSSTTSPAPSRWQQMLVGAGAAVGTARAVVSEESMKSLRYCLQWLQYATQHLEHQITILQDLIAKLTTPSSSDAMIHSNAPLTLSAIKKKIVDNLRKVIDVVSRYASNCLPDQAKQNVRSFILSLPTRWATINHSDISTSASPLSSPQLNPVNAHPNNQTADYARRLLSLATESLDMLRRVGGIFGETVERAEAWVVRLRSIPPVAWSSQQSVSTTNDYSYGQSSSTLHPSPGFRPRKSSNSSRVSNRKYTSRIIPDDDDESVTNNYDSDDSDDSEVENKRMEDNRSHRSLKNSNSIKSPPSHGGLNSGKKRKKIAKKDDSMDITETF